MGVATAEPELDWFEIWREFGDAYVARVDDAISRAERNVERELLFCLLGGHAVPFELAHSATQVLAPLDVFAPEWDLTELETTVRAQLQQPQFEPRRLDGSLRRYRYPQRKAQLIGCAAGWLRQNSPLVDVLAAINDEGGRRKRLCECPGVGLKTASWLLRNIGLAEQLAVIDVHVLRALVDAGRVSGARLPRDYVVVERQFLDWCDELGASPAAFDLLLWEWQRAT